MQYCKRLALDNVKNARDLGGVPTLDGNITKWNNFFENCKS